MAPLPANADATLSAALTLVSCPETGSCVAEGGYRDGTANEEVFDSLSGGVWNATEAPLPANANADPTPSPAGLGCASVDSCAAVGMYEGQNGDSYGLVQTLWRGTWTATTAPVATDAVVPHSAGVPVSDLVAVTCLAAGSCVAIGSYGDTNGDQPGLIEIQSGQTWTATEAPDPANAANPSAFPFAVPCPTTDFCTSSWLYQDAPNDDPGFFDTLTGGPPSPTLPSVAAAAPTSSTITLGQSEIDVATVSGEASAGSPTGVGHLLPMRTDGHSHALHLRSRPGLFPGRNHPGGRQQHVGRRLLILHP